MKRTGTVLCLCVLLGFGLKVNGAWAFSKKPALPASKVSSDATQHPVALSATEDIAARTLHTSRWITDNPDSKKSLSQKSSYTEIRPSLHVLTSDSQYKEAEPTLTATLQGAEAKQLNHPVRFQSDLSYGRPTVEQGDQTNPVLQASPALIVYRDLSTDRSVVLARSQPASLSFEKNIATYKDAFDHLRADVRYTVRANNLEQDVLLFEKPLKPSAYGLNDATTVLAVMTRVFSLEDRIASNYTLQSPSTHQTLAQSKTDLNKLMTPRIAGPIVLEQDGQPIQQFARSYVLSKNSKQPVHKRLVTVQGLHFLAEEIPATYFQSRDLPLAATTKSPRVSKHTPFTQLEVMANANFTSEDRMAEVRTTLVNAPVVIDFISVTGTIPDFTFEQGETYLVSGPAMMTGTTTFEGGAVIKFDSTGSLDVDNPIFNTTSSNWVVFTSNEDDSVGEVTGSTGIPASYPNALTLAKGGVRYVQIRYASEGIVFAGNDALTVRDSEFFAVGTPVNASSSAGPATVNLNNLLIVQGTNGPVLADDGVSALTVTANNLTMAHLTGDGLSNTTTAAGSTLSVTDSLFVDIQGVSVFAGTAPTTENFNAFFQTPGTGSGANNVALTADPILTDWFLDQTSPVINAGSDTAFNTGLYHYTTDTNGILEANSQTDIGYHAPPDINSFSVLATNSVFLDATTIIHSGNVGVNDIGPGPFLKPEASLYISKEITTPADAALFGDSVRVNSAAVVASDVHYNSLNLIGTITGQQVTPLSHPIFDALPLLRTAELGATPADITVGAAQQVTLSPGEYNNIVVGKAGSIVFTGGTYHIRSLFSGDDTQLLFNTPSELRIQEDFVTKKNTYTGPAAGSDLDADDILVHVEGAGIATHHINLGQFNVLFAHLYAPNGTLWTGDSSQVHGIFIARDVGVAKLSQVNLDVTPAINTVSAPIILPAGGSFFDSVQVNMFTITSGATIHYTTDGSTPTTASPVFTAPFTLTTNATPHTVKSIAVRSGYNDSSISSVTLTVIPRPTTEEVTFDPVAGTFQDSVEVTLSSATPGATIRFTTDGTPPTILSPVFNAPFTLTETATVQAFATFPDFNDSAITSATYTIDTTPPIPGIIENAPPLDETLIYNVATSTSFLYTGINGAPPLQTGMDPATIEPVRAAVVRGQVFQRDPADINAPPIPLEGVTMTILGHDDPLGPEFYGQTLSRADGFFDMAVNGGGQLVVQYSKTGFLPAQRKVQVPWQDFAITEDVVLIPLDPQVTTVDLAAITTVTEAQGTKQTDSDGTRTATLLFSPGTTAEMVLPDGTKQAITSLSLRATEYTVGPNGPMAMPAILPPTSAYTYMADFTADEALAAGATSIEFNQPVYGYVDNFLDVKPGQIVPNGFYDRVKGQWIPEDNGLVIDIIDIDNSGANPIAVLDLDGDNVADDPTLPPFDALNITPGELKKLAELYPGATPATPAGLWRVPMLHFSNFHWAMIASRAVEAGFDWNFPAFVEGLTIQDPNSPEAKENSDNDNPCELAGSIIQCEAQIFGEAIPVTGTPFTLYYNSDRVRGYQAGTSLEIPLIDSRLLLNDTTLSNIHLSVEVAGRRFQFACPPAELVAGKTQHTFVWDGLDAYGRETSGAFTARITIGYEYPFSYGGAPKFGRPAQAILQGRGGPTFSPVGRQSVVFTQKYTKILSLKNFRSIGLGGWTLDANHVFDPFGPTLHLGTGPRRGTQSLPDVVTTVASGLSARFAEHLRINEKGEIIFGGNGLAGGFISKVNTDNSVTTLVAQAISVSDIALAPDGTIYWSGVGGGGAHWVRKRNPDGSIEHVAGSPVLSTFGFSGDGGPAKDALLSSPSGVAVDKEGNVYIGDTNNHRVRMIDTDGIIQTIAGNGTTNVGPSEGPALQTPIASPTKIVVDDQGTIYVFSNSGGRIMKIDTSGIATHFAGTNNTSIGDGLTDGIPATETLIQVLFGMGLDKEGTLYWTGRHNFLGANRQVLKFVDPNGKVRTISQTPCSGAFQENGPVDTNCIFPQGLDFHPDGDLIVASRAVNRIFRIGSALPGFTVQQQVLPSEDGSLLYVFDASGRHTETRNALTNATVFEFGYDAAGQLSSVTDGDGDATTIQRDPVTGDPVSITSQDGQVTTFTLDANGYLATVANPNNETFQMAYDAGGLMTAFTRPKALTDPGTNYTSTITYNALGKLIKDENPAGGFIALARTETENGHTVTDTTAEGRVATKNIETDVQGNTTRTNTNRAGLTTVTQELANGNVISTSPDGTQTTVTKLPDPRFGMLAPLASLRVQTPSGLTSTITPSRSITEDPTTGALLRQDDLLNINGRIFDIRFVKVDPSVFPTDNVFVDISPEGRLTRAFTDAQGRVVQQQTTGIFDTDFSYDTRGRLTGVVQGDGTPAVDRASAITYYDSVSPAQQGFIESITDPVGRVVSFEYDPAGRVTKQILPDLREINFTYDANGNVASITPPGRPLHGFDYTSVDLENEYAPPNVTPPLADTRTFFSYNLDKQLTSVTRPDGQVISMNYDTGGRLSTVTLPENPPATPQIYTYDYYSDIPANAGQIGNLEKITAPDGGTLSFTYDGSLLLSSTWGGPVGSITGSVSRTYDTDFRITSRSVNGGNTISFGYDNDSLLTSAGAETLQYDSEDSANPGTFFTNGLLRSTTLGIVTDAYQHNSFGEVSNYSAQISGADEFNTTFVRDKLGRITKKTETVGVVTHIFDYLYNDAGYLVEVKRDGVVQNTYTYDLNGNRLTNADSTKTITGEYDDQDRLTKLTDSTNPPIPVEYIYTDNGELLTKTEGTDNTHYKYDVLGNLLSVQLPDGNLIEYIIDGRNRRIGKKFGAPGATVLQKAWLYKDGLNPIAELDGAGNVTARFVYASRANVPDYVIKGGTTYRIISDHLGSPRLVVDTTTGAVAQQIEYDEWGKILVDTAPGFQPFAFAGGLYDADTKLIRFGARDYDPETGRWAAKDPINFDGDGPNLYGYALNDPVNLRDPNGEFVVTAFLIGAAIGVAFELFDQLVLEDKSLDCLNLGDIAISGLVGGFGGVAAQALARTAKVAKLFKKARDFINKTRQRRNLKKQAKALEKKQKDFLKNTKGEKGIAPERTPGTREFRATRGDFSGLPGGPRGFDPSTTKGKLAEALRNILKNIEDIF